jgi:small-conductance mechanosensitive channel
MAKEAIRRSKESMRNKGLLFTIFLLAVMIFVVIRSLMFGSWESTLFPVIIGSICLVLLILVLWKELRTRNQSAPEDKVEVPTGGTNILIIMVWLASFAIGIYLLGFLIAIIVFIFTYLKMHRISWLSSTIMAVATTGILYSIFKFGLGLELYNGLVFQMLSLQI